MTPSLSLFTIIRDNDFKKIAFYDKLTIIFILTLSLISVVIYAAFPLVTQVFIKLYSRKDVNLLILATFIFFIIFLFKLIIDIVVNKYEIKYYVKIDKNIKEHIVNKYGDDPKMLFGKNSVLYKKDIKLYILLIRTLYRNFQDTAKILTISMIIFFYDKKLFLYISFIIPVVLLFYFAGKRFSVTKQAKKRPYFESDFALMLKKSMDLNHNYKDRKRFYMKCFEETMKTRIVDRTRFIPMKVLMGSLISFFRLFYLAYFGYYIIISGFKLDGLIVGLLYITIFIRPIINILLNINNYERCKGSFFRVNSLLNKELK